MVPQEGELILLPTGSGGRMRSRSIAHQPGWGLMGPHCPLILNPHCRPCAQALRKALTGRIPSAVRFCPLILSTRSPSTNWLTPPTEVATRTSR